MADRKHIHLIGIGGTGLSAIAKVLLEQGHVVSGSDMHLSPLAESIEAAGATVVIGHDAKNIAGADAIIQSSAIPASNPELIAAKEAGIPVFKRSTFLKEWITQECLAVAGTHGKTTTTSMWAWVMESLGTNPAFIIGSVAKNLGTNARAGDGQYFVIEADEYDYMFHGLTPRVAIITNMQHDHPDCFPTMEIYRQAFVDFANRIVPNGDLILCADDEEACGLKTRVREDIHVHTYGFNEAADYRIFGLPRSTDTFDYAILHKEAPLVILRLGVSGQHNALNAAAVIAAVHELGVDIVTAAAALGAFEGSDRRFDVLGTWAGVTLIDDYAHHPTEIKATLQAARQTYPRQHIHVVWQPHTYSRTITLLKDFVIAFGKADTVLVTDVYAAREKNDDFSGEWLVKQIEHDNVHFTPTLADAVEELYQTVKPGDVVIVCSAGSAIAINKSLRQGLSSKEQPELWR